MMLRVLSDLALMLCNPLNSAKQMRQFLEFVLAAVSSVVFLWIALLVLGVGFAVVSGLFSRRLDR